MSVERQLLEAAFPDGKCALCGRSRRRAHALCPSCWHALGRRLQSEYLGLDIIDRARWILERAKLVGGLAAWE